VETDRGLVSKDEFNGPDEALGHPSENVRRSHFAAQILPDRLAPPSSPSSLKGLSVAQTNLFVLMSPGLNVAPE
jgi:hypothetical protein